MKKAIANIFLVLTILPLIIMPITNSPDSTNDSNEPVPYDYIDHDLDID